MHFSYRKTATSALPELDVQVAVCAVDAADVVLLCGVIHAQQADPRIEDGDSWIGPADLPAACPTRPVSSSCPTNCARG
ncbi:hypothetical protein [Kitasatospora paranensis]|uniref:hypothetical protein n=1 Tax=Kitasatospora paranensis TaxID=258053 RepID=UPI0031ED9992